MTASGPTEYDEDEASQQRWEQPRFGPAMQPVSGTLLPAGAWAARPATAVVPPSVEEDRLRLVVRLIWPVAIVLAITTGHWLPLLVAALVVGGILRRRLFRLRYQRLALARVPLAPTLR